MVLYEVIWKPQNVDDVEFNFIVRAEDVLRFIDLGLSMGYTTTINSHWD